MTHHSPTHRIHRLDAPDVRAMIRLCNDLHLSPQREDYKHKLLEGIRELTDADRVWASVAAFGSASDMTPNVVSATHVSRSGSTTKSGGDSRERTAVAPWASYRAYSAKVGASAWSTTDWCTTAKLSSRRRGAKPEQCLHSFVPLAEGRIVACLTVARGADKPKFTGRDCSVVCVLHSEVGWVYRGDVMLLSPDTRSLSPRERETLQYLLAGKGEKQIAVAMRLSHNTIHHYVKALHKHFKVSSRSELLARWVK